MRKAEDGTVALVEDEERKRLALTANTELNFISPTALKLLRTKKVGPISSTYFEVYNKTAQYPTPVSDGYLQEIKTIAEDQERQEDIYDVSTESEGVVLAAPPDVDAAPSVKDMEFPISEPEQPRPASTATPSVVPQPAPTKWSDESVAQVDLPDVPLRFPEKRRLHWSNKTCM